MKPTTVALCLCVGLCAGPCAAPLAQAEENGFIGPAGRGWSEVSWQRWRATERFAGPYGPDTNVVHNGQRVNVGDRVPLKLDLPGASFSSDSVEVKLRVVPLERLMLRVSLPAYQRNVYQQAGSTTTTTGVGDVRTFVGYQVTPLDSSLGSALYLHTKWPTTQLQVEDLSVPLGEGQVDVGLEQATTWAALSQLWITGRLQLRYRAEATTRIGETTARIKPGNEFDLGLEIAGGPLPLLWVKTSYRGMFAAAHQDRTVPGAIRAIEQRQIHWWGADAYYRFGALLHPSLDELAVDLKLRLPLAGVDFLAGPAYGVGLAYGFEYAG